jgi:hypothetical protein
MSTLADELALRAFREVDFNWAVRLEDVWRDPVGDVPNLHQNARLEIVGELEHLHHQNNDGSPLGRFIVGEAGSGKTHLLGAIRRAAAQHGFGFILVDMTDVRDFWETVAQGYLNSLQVPYVDGKPQFAFLLEKMIARIPLKHDVVKALHLLSVHRTEQLKRNIRGVLALLQKTFPRQAQAHQDTIRALICLNSESFDIRSSGMTWLQSVELDDEMRKLLQFTKAREEPREIVRALSWIISLAGPSVVAFDQLDPIVHQVARQTAPHDLEEQNAARLIIDRIGNGFAAIRDVTSKTLVIVSCLEASLQVLTGEVLKSNLDRYHPPMRLRWDTPDFPSTAVYRHLIEARLAEAYRKVGWTPPYPTWPFAMSAIEALQGQSPRRLLQLCDAHRRRCVEAGVITELTSFTRAGVTDAVPVHAFENLDQEFQAQRGKTDFDALRSEKNEEDLLGAIYQTAYQCLVFENEPALPENVFAYVDQNFGGGNAMRPLHARLRIQFQSEGDREEHFCVRALLRTQHRAFKVRLQAAMTESGIDKKLSFRKLTMIRFGDPPGGVETKNLLKKFDNFGGRFHCPSDDELRTLSALHTMARAKYSQWTAWLADRKPVSRVGLGHVLAPGSVFDGVFSSDREGEAPAEPVHRGSAGASPSRSVSAVTLPAPVKAVEVVAVKSMPAKAAPSPAPPGDIFLGHRLVGETLRQAVFLPVPLLEKHTFVVAGAGSGKTVLLKRIVEEAALAGIPSIVIDGANDLSTLGDRRPSLPADFSEGERDQAERYFENADVVIWTPGVERGNPLQLNPLPDFSAVAGDAEAVEESVEIAVDGLADLIATGSPAVRNKKIGVLRSILRYFAKDGGGNLEALIALLREPPGEALLGIDREMKLARDLSDTLRVSRENNPLLRSAGTALDPATLFGDAQPNGKTRVSVINLAGLNGAANQQQFLNQLGMTLFDWAKKHPSPPNRALRGLFILDEAKDFVPSRTTSACKRSLMRCAAQLRKYHIGMVFATQSPKDLENTIIQNCSTQFYGKVSSPVAIETVRELMRLKGGTGNDISNLSAGVFYLHNADADYKTPTKIKVPLCVSHHRANAPDANEIIAMAVRSDSLKNQA